MGKRVLRFGSVIVLVLVLSFGLFPGSAETLKAAEKKVIKLTFQGKWVGHEKQNWAAEQLKLKDYVAKATNGRIAITNINEIVKDNEVIDAVRTGVVDMGCQGLFSRRELFVVNFLSLPFVPHKRVPEIMAKLKRVYARIWSDQLGVQQLGYAYFLPQYLYTKEPADTFQALRKMKLRVLGNLLVQLFKNAGAIPITMNHGEVYTSLQRGLIDGAQTALPGYISGAWYEVCKYISAWPLGSAGMGLVMNKEVWNNLGPELQGQFMSAVAVFEKSQFEGVYKDINKVEQKARSLGAIRRDPSQAEKDKLLAYVGPVLENWKSKAGPYAEDVLKAINKVLDTNYK